MRTPGKERFGFKQAARNAATFLQSCSSDPKSRRLGFALFFITLILLEAVLYRNFLFGNHYLIYTNVGSDSWAQSVPLFLSAAEKISRFDFSTWNFSQYLGALTPQAFDLNYIVSLFGADNVAPLMLFSQIAKSILAGVFFYFYSFYLGARYETRFIGGLALAFCGRMMALSAWVYYTMEVTLTVALLWAFERFLADKAKFLALPLVFAILIAAESVYGLILYSFFMLIYVASRLIYGDHSLTNTRAIIGFCARLLGLYVLGVCLSSIALLPYLENYANSARVSSLSASPSTLLAVSSPQILATQILSMMATGAFGTEMHYTGILNVLNTPYYYCGAIIVFAVPLSFFGKTRRQRAGIAVAAIAAIVYLVFSGFRFALNGFGLSGDDFRTSSFWITLVLAYLGVLGLENLWEGTHKKAAIVTVAIELLFLASCFGFMTGKAQVLPLIIASIALISFGLLFAQNRINPLATTVMIIVVFCAELVVQSNPIINQTPVVSREQYEAEYNTLFHQELDRIDGSDEGLYRVSYPTLLLTRPLAYGYLGTQAYIGGTGLAQEQIDFLRNVIANDYVERMGYSRYAYGFNDNNINTLLGVRYAVIPSDEKTPYIPFGYSQISDANDPFLIYENNYALPFIMSYSYEEAVSAQQLESLPREDRGAALLETCVVPNGYRHEGVITPVKTGMNLLVTSSDSATFNGNAILLDIPETDAPFILVTADLSVPSRESGNLAIEITLTSASGQQTTATHLTAGGNEQVRLPVADEGICTVSIQQTTSNFCDDAIISNAAVYALPASYYDAYASVVNDKRAEDPQVSIVNNSLVSGALSMADDGYIVTSVPWSESWHAYVDGLEKPTLLVNYGFVGIEAPAGYHELELRYEDRGQIIGIALSLITMALLAGIKGLTMRRADKRGKQRR